MNGKDVVYNHLNQFLSIDVQRFVLYCLIIFVAYIFIKFFTNRRKRFKALSKIQKMPPNIWFYSRLIDYELSIEKVNAQKLQACFYEYLERKYKLSDSDMNKKSIFEWVKAKESDEEYIDLYGDIYNQLNDMKQLPTNEVITYIKSIKKYFNQEDLTEWIEKRRQENCNNC